MCIWYLISKKIMRQVVMWLSRLIPVHQKQLWPPAKLSLWSHVGLELPRASGVLTLWVPVQRLISRYSQYLWTFWTIIEQSAQKVWKRENKDGGGQRLSKCVMEPKFQPTAHSQSSDLCSSWPATPYWHSLASPRQAINAATVKTVCTNMAKCQELKRYKKREK